MGLAISPAAGEARPSPELQHANSGILLFAFDSYLLKLLFLMISKPDSCNLSS
jgi:hypothetical protein